MRKLPGKLSSTGVSYSIKRQAVHGVYYIKQNSVASSLSNDCEQCKLDKNQLKYHLNATRRNNDIYRQMVQKLTLDNQTLMDQYLESIEYNKELKTEISSLKQNSNEQNEMMSEIERLKSSLESQIGLVL